MPSTTFAPASAPPRTTESESLHGVGWLSVVYATDGNQ